MLSSECHIRLIKYKDVYISLNLFNITIFALVSCTTRTSVYGGITTADHMIAAGHTGGCTGLRRMQDRQRVGTNSLSQFRQLRIKPRLEEKTCKFCYFVFFRKLLFSVIRMCYRVLYVNISQSKSQTSNAIAKLGGTLLIKQLELYSRGLVQRKRKYPSKLNKLCFI